MVKFCLGLTPETMKTDKLGFKDNIGNLLFNVLQRPELQSAEDSKKIAKKIGPGAELHGGISWKESNSLISVHCVFLNLCFLKKQFPKSACFAT